MATAAIGIAGAAAGLIAAGTTVAKEVIDANATAGASKNATTARTVNDSELAAKRQNAENDEMAMAMIGTMPRAQAAGGDQQYMQLMGYDQTGGQPGEPAQPPDPSTPRQRTLG